MNKMDMLASIEEAITELSRVNEQMDESEILEITTDAYNLLSEIFED